MELSLPYLTWFHLPTEPIPFVSYSSSIPQHATSGYSHGLSFPASVLPLYCWYNIIFLKYILKYVTKVLKIFRDFSLFSQLIAKHHTVIPHLFNLLFNNNSHYSLIAMVPFYCREVSLTLLKILWEWSLQKITQKFHIKLQRILGCFTSSML